VNKRVRLLEESGYIKRIGTRKTKAGFPAAVYELTARTYLAILLDHLDLEWFLTISDDAKISTILAEILA